MLFYLVLILIISAVVAYRGTCFVFALGSADPNWREATIDLTAVMIGGLVLGSLLDKVLP